MFHMKRMNLSIVLLTAALLTSLSSHAQSLKDLLNKENVEKAVNALTGKSTTTDLTGTWVYTGPAVEFESDNLLAKAGGSLASSTVESKMSEYLAKVGIEEGKMSFTFQADSTFTSVAGTRNLQGTYSYNAESQTLQLKFSRLVNLNAQVNCTSSQMDLLFKSDKLLALITYLSKKSSNSTLKSISALAENYNGMMTGLSLKKQ